MATKQKAAKSPSKKPPRKARGSSPPQESDAPEDRSLSRAPRGRGAFEDNDYGSGYEPRGAGGDSEEHIMER